MSSKPTIRIGARFCERVAQELRQSATFANRGDFPEAQRCYEDVEQMLDTFLTETGIGAYLEREREPVSDTVVPAVRKPDQQSERVPSADQAGAGDAEEDVRDGGTEAASDVAPPKRRKSNRKARQTKGD